MDVKPGLDSLHNFRDLSYLKNREGRRVHNLLRSEALYGISEKDLAILYEDYHLRKIIDLRNSLEINEKKDPLIQDVEWVKCSLQEKSDLLVVQDEKTRKEKEAYFRRLDKKCQNEDFARKHMCNFYHDIVKDDCFLVGARRFFDECLSAKEAVLFHCSLGRDRCGMMAALLLEALEVRKEDIFSDYLRSNDSLNSESYYDLAHREYLESFYEGIKDKWGKTESLLDSLGLKRSELKEKYLETV